MHAGGEAPAEAYRGADPDPRAVLEQLPAALIVAAAPSGQLILGNARVADVLRHPFLEADDVSGYVRYLGFDGDGRALPPDAWPLARSLRGETVAGERIDVQRGDGTRGVIETFSAPIRDGEGEVVAAAVVFHDVTDAVHAQLALGAERDRQAALLRSLQDALVVSDAGGRVREVNERWVELLGYSVEESVGQRPPYPWMPPDAAGRSRFEEAVQLALRETGGDFEIELQRRDGRAVEALVTVAVLRDEAGEVVDIIAMLKDVTARRRAEERVSQLQEIAAELSAAVNVEAVARAVVESGLRTLDADAGVLVMASPDGEHYETVCAQGYPPAIEERFQHFTTASGLLIPEVIASGQSVFVERLAAADLPHMPAFLQEGLRAGGVVPLLADSRPLGALGFSFREERRFTIEERELFETLGRLAGQAIDRARLYDEQRDVALILQRSLLPSLPAAIGPLRIATAYRPAMREAGVGGDWFDVIRLDADHVALVVGDVVGRGLRAATAMGELRSVIEGLSLVTQRPAELLEHLDSFVANRVDTHLCTALYATLDLRTSALRYSSAGHPPALVVPPDGRAPFYLEGALGPPPSARITSRPETAVQLPPGSLLVLYTDGLIERRGRTLDVGFRLLAEAAAAVADRSPEEALEAIVSRLMPREGGNDDAGVVVVRLPVA